MKQMGGTNLLGTTGRFENVLKRSARIRYLPWAVLLLTLAGSWQVWKSAERHALQERKAEFDMRVQGAVERIRQRMLDYEQVLYGTRGFLVSQRQVERREFSGYIESLQLGQRLPGIQGISYAPLVQGARKQAHVASLRQGGLEGYAIHPDGVRDQYAPVAYIEPYSGRNRRVLGFDNFSSPQRRAALEKARDLNQAVLSEKLTLVQENGQVPQRGCLMFLPVYKADTSLVTLAERRANIAGWLAASFRMNDLIAGLLTGNAAELDIHIYDGSEPSEPALLFDSDDDGRVVRSPASRFETFTQLEIGGRPWRIAAQSLPAFEAGMDKSKAYLTALSAFLLSLVLTWITAMLVRDRSRAVKLAAGASAELRRSKEFQAALQESERRWKLALEAAGHGVWDWDMQTDEVACSELSKNMRGYSADNYPYRFFRDWGAGVHPDDLPQLRAVFQDHVEGNAPTFIFEYRALCKNGEWKWIVTRGTVVERDSHGQPLRMLGTHTDISDRRAMQAALEEQKEISDSIIDSLPGNFYMIDTNGRHVRWNRHVEEVTGYTAEEIARLDTLQLFEGDERVAVQKKIQEVFEQGQGEIEAELLSKDGRKIPYHFSARRSIIGGQPYVVGVGFDVSERRAAETALRESEARYREIFNDASYFVFTLDTAQRITFAPSILAQITGYEPEEVIGAHVGKILTPEGLLKVQQMISMKLRGEASVTQYETTLLRRDGSVIPIEVNTSLIYKQGKVVGVQGVGRDITERHQYEQSLRESEEKYRGLFESAGDFAYSTDLKGNFTTISELLLAAMGFERGELKSITQILSAEQLALAQKMTAAKLSGENQVTRYELELTTRDGRAIPTEVVSTLVYKDGEPVGVQGIGREIAERKRAEELLRRSERNYRELMEQAAEAIFVTDHEGRHCVEVNQAACDLLGYTREELLALEVSKIFHPDEIAVEPIKFDEVRAGQTTYTRRRFRRKDGSYVPVELGSRMLSDGRLQALVRDISEWLDRESALREANVKAEAASRTKSEFLANMSHEIRTPMNSVIGMARLALSRETDARQVEYLEKILMSGEHLLGIIDDILDFSKIEAGKMQIESADFDLRGLLDNLASLMTDKAMAKGLEFVVDADPVLPAKMRGDPLRLRQVLLNFADNAIKFTERGEVRVSARKINDGEAGCAVLFEVRDTGIGMSFVDMAMLFRPFQQTDGSVTRKYGGTGLGLSISKRLVELMGGEVGVESEPGRGSRFWFRVHLDEGRQDVIPAAERVDVRRDVQAAVRNARILLAENNVFNQQVAREFLELAGCVVHVANNGAEVLDLLRNEHFDCILMDVQMPVVDGLEATRRIRANQTFASMPVIAVTANALEEERQRCMDAGMNDFVTKPLRPEMLYAVLAKWLSRQMLPLSMPAGKKRAAKDRPPKKGAAIDFAVLAELVGGDHEKMRQMAHKFMETARQDMDRVKAALAANDLVQLSEMGHHMKSPAAMVGAAGLADLCRALEANRDGLDLARELVSQMSQALAELDGRVEEQLPRG